MTNKIAIRKLKTFAKRYARANRIAQHRSLDIVAAELGFSHWNALVTASNSDWLPCAEDLEKIEAFVGVTHPTLEFREVDTNAINLRFGDLERTEEGEIQGHAYRLMDALHDVYLAGEGWAIRIPEAPKAAPIVEIAEQSLDSSSNPINDPEFLQEALQIAKAQSQQIRAQISTDWPRRSTKPDAEGNVRHPLTSGLSNVWFCLHCNGEITGPQIAENLWHCPACGASPLDIFATPFWLDDNNDRPMPVLRPQVDQNIEPEIKIVDTKLKLELNEKNVSLLIRSALLDDATNTNEQMAALLADISVDEDNDVWVTFDEELWPEDKKPVQALVVAKLLGIEVEQEIASTTPPFAWPGLGELTSSTREYTEMLLDAYAKHGTSLRSD